VSLQMILEGPPPKDSTRDRLARMLASAFGSATKPTLNPSGPGHSAGEASRRERVLLIEDDRAIREVIRQFLSDACEVRQAATGAEALAILRGEPVAAVVLDYRLPDRTGLELLSDIKSQWPALPVAMMTGYGSEWICAWAFKLGVRDYFPKPVRLEDLRHWVCATLFLDAIDGEETGAASQSPPGSEPPPAAPDLPIQRAIALIQQRYWDHLSLGRLAHEVGMSKYHLSRRFKAVMGVTFRQHLLRVRLERAKTLLSTTLISITEVAQAVGFSDLPRFDKLFRRYAGVAPSVYRARQARSGK
jgi:two-component system, response regulator YesN